MRLSKSFVILLALACLLIFTQETSAQAIRGYTSCDYDDSTNTITVYSETRTDYELGPYYEGFVHLKVYKDGVLIDSQYDYDGGTGFSFLLLQYPATPGSTYVAKGYHSANSYLYDYDEFNPSILYYYDNWGFGRFESQNVYQPWYYTFLSDVFQNRLRSEQEIPLGATHSSDVAQVPPLGVEIMLDGLKVTGLTRDVVVGQRINLSLQAEPSGATVSNVQWTVPGTRVANYIANGTTGTVTPLSNLNTSSISFYWVDGASGRQVTLSCKVNGTPFTKTVKFNVKRPTAQVTTATGAVNISSAWGGGTSLHFGVPQKLGIIFTHNVTYPSGLTGTLAWIQLAKLNRKRQLVVNSSWEKLVEVGLDGSFPYPSASSNSANDSPRSPLDNTLLKKSADDSFEMWLLFKPSGATSIWVPLRKVSWSWSGVATRNGNIWDLSSPSNSVNPASVDSTTHPEWTRVINLQNWVPE